MKRELKLEDELWLQKFELTDFGNNYWVSFKYKLIKYLIKHYR